MFKVAISFLLINSLKSEMCLSRFLHIQKKKKKKNTFKGSKDIIIASYLHEQKCRYRCSQSQEPDQTCKGNIPVGLYLFFLIFKTI